MLCVRSDSMTSPGTMKAPYATPSISLMRDPMAAPKTTKYKDVEITGDTMLCRSVRQVRAISKV